MFHSIVFWKSKLNCTYSRGIGFLFPKDFTGVLNVYSENQNQLHEQPALVHKVNRKSAVMGVLWLQFINICDHNKVNLAEKRRHGWECEEACDTIHTSKHVSLTRNVCRQEICDKFVKRRMNGQKLVANLYLVSALHASRSHEPLAGSLTTCMRRRHKERITFFLCVWCQKSFSMMSIRTQN